MKTERISEVRIDTLGRLCVIPETQTFPFIYRSGMEVHWDESGRFLYSPVPREWSYTQWFLQIVGAVASEYGFSLLLTPQTRWQNIDSSQQAAILAATSSSNA